MVLRLMQNLISFQTNEAPSNLITPVTSSFVEHVYLEILFKTKPQLRADTTQTDGLEKPSGDAPMKRTVRQMW